MEGFPHQGDELRYLCSKGLFPDAAAILQVSKIVFGLKHLKWLYYINNNLLLQVEEANMLDRILPGKMAIWQRKRDRRLEKKMQAREKRLKEWVRKKLS